MVLKVYAKKEIIDSRVVYIIAFAREFNLKNYYQFIFYSPRTGVINYQLGQIIRRISNRLKCNCIVNGMYNTGNEKSENDVLIVDEKSNNFSFYGLVNMDYVCNININIKKASNGDAVYLLSNCIVKLLYGYKGKDIALVYGILGTFTSFPKNDIHLFMPSYEKLISYLKKEDYEFITNSYSKMLRSQKLQNNPRQVLCN